MNKLQRSIIQALAFHDLFNRPLTLDELWHGLYRCSGSKLQVLLELKKMIAEKKVFVLGSYYGLDGKETLAKDFINRSILNRDRWLKAYRIINILKRVPFVKNISIINSLSYDNSNENSDIDILIITKKNRLWTARALTVLLLEIIGQNKNKWHKAGKFCLGFAFDETRLNLSKIKYRDDIDFTYWLTNLTPVYDKGIYTKLIESNPWIKGELPNWEEKKCKIQNAKFRIIEKMLSGQQGNRLEKWLTKIQINRIWKDPKNKRKEGSVIADEGMMKLHPYDKRKERFRKWQVLTKKALEIK